jgi:hypothetical protein
MEPELKPYTTATPKIGALLACLPARGKFDIAPIGTASTEIAPWFGESHVAKTYSGGALASYGGIFTSAPSITRSRGVLRMSDDIGDS